MDIPDPKQLWAELQRRRVVRAALYYIAGAWILAQVLDLLLDALGWEPTTLDALQQRLGWPVDRLLARLLELELDGQLRAIDGGRYERCPLR